MPSAAKHKQIDAVMEKASEALTKTQYFEAERLAVKALSMARQAGEFEYMARIVMPLQEARRQRVQIALDKNKVYLIDEPFTEEATIKPGCVIVQPPLVGADSRRYRLLALSREIPIAIICREPLTKLKLLPVVAIGPGATLRVKVQAPPANAKPAQTVAWLAQTLRTLGDVAVESLDPTLPIIRKIDALLDRVDCLPEHENLHQALADACRQACTEQAAGRLQLQPEDLERSAPRNQRPARTGIAEL